VEPFAVVEAVGETVQNPEVPQLQGGENVPLQRDELLDDRNRRPEEGDVDDWLAPLEGTPDEFGLDGLLVRPCEVYQ
jgi:hypothetical protein